MQVAARSRWIGGQWRRLCSSIASSEEFVEKEKPLVAAAVLERLPVFPRQMHPTVKAFKELSFKWKQIIGEIDVLEKSLEEMKASVAPAPEQRPVETTNRKSLHRLLDQRLYLIVNGTPSQGQKGKPVWHFPEILHTDGPDVVSLRTSAFAALNSFMGDISEVYFAGHAPSGHLEFADFKRFFYRCHFAGNKDIDGNAAYKDFAWVSKEELNEYFDETHMELFNCMLPNF